MRVGLVGCMAGGRGISLLNVASVLADLPCLCKHRNTCILCLCDQCIMMLITDSTLFFGHALTFNHYDHFIVTF